MVESPARGRNATSGDVTDLRSDLREHTTTDRLQFERLDERMEDLIRGLADLKSDVGALNRTFNRLGWSGWAIAGGLVSLLARSFLPGLLH